MGGSRGSPRGGGAGAAPRSQEGFGQGGILAEHIPTELERGLCSPVTHGHAVGASRCSRYSRHSRYSQQSHLRLGRSRGSRSGRSR